MNFDIKRLTIKDIEFYKRYQEQYYMNNPPYYKSKHDFHIGQVVQIDKSISHDVGYKNQLGIVIGLSGIDYYVYVISYDNTIDKYSVCGFEELDLTLTDKHMKSEKTLYREFERYLINNSFNLCTSDFAELYKKHLNNRMSKGNIIYVNFG